MRFLHVVPTTDSRITYAGNASTTAFPITFVFELDSHVVATLVNDESGAAVVQTLGVHYTLSGGGGFTGTLTMIAAPATGETLVIQRIVPFTQLTNLRDGDPFRATTQMLTYDRIVEMIQQLADAVGRSVVGPITLPILSDGSGLVFPAPTDETLIVGTGSGWESRAISAVIGGAGFSLASIQIFNNSGAYEKPGGSSFAGFAIAECVGSGGGGGGAGGSGDAAVGGGGGGGAYAWTRIPDIDMADSVPVTVGAAGAGAGAGGGNGSAGGDTSFGSACLAKGGAGGAGDGGGSGDNSAAGGAGGLASASTGDLTADGGDGGDGIRANDSASGSNNTRITQTGLGGASVYGGNTRAPRDGAGIEGKKYGGGGSGASTTSSARAAGSGYKGVCIVYTFGGSI